ncbi:hypothetical protein BJ912DRAFT_962611 [Pholiota molesta]|nr:hypothetical protein BJ912DRAFT_962611 [Pholiota molesta]
MGKIPALCTVLLYPEIPAEASIRGGRAKHACMREEGGMGYRQARRRCWQAGVVLAQCPAERGRGGGCGSLSSLCPSPLSPRRRAGCRRHGRPRGIHPRRRRGFCCGATVSKYWKWARQRRARRGHGGCHYLRRRCPVCGAMVRRADGMWRRRTSWISHFVGLPFFVQPPNPLFVLRVLRVSR